MRRQPGPEPDELRLSASTADRARWQSALGSQRRLILIIGQAEQPAGAASGERRANHDERDTSAEFANRNSQQYPVGGIVLGVRSKQ
jgi:hypothetical protein